MMKSPLEFSVIYIQMSVHGNAWTLVYVFEFLISLQTFTLLFYLFKMFWFSGQQRQHTKMKFNIQVNLKRIASSSNLRIMNWSMPQFLNR